MTWSHANKLHLKKHSYMLWSYSLQHFVANLNNNWKKRKKKATHKNQTAYKKRNFIFGGLLFTMWFGRGSGSWQKTDLRLEKGKALMDKCSSRWPLLSLVCIHTQTYRCECTYTYTHMHTHYPLSATQKNLDRMAGNTHRVVREGYDVSNHEQ